MTAGKGDGASADRAWAERFPALFAPGHIGYANADVTFTTGPGERRPGPTPHTRNGSPFRSHLSHPVSSWRYAVAPVAIDSLPTNLDDGEQVVEVCALPPAEADAYLRRHDDTHADVVRLVEAMRLIGG